MDRATMKDLLLRRLREIDQGEFSTAELEQALNEGCRRVQNFVFQVDPNRFLAREIRDLEAGVDNYPWPSDFLSAYAIQVKDSNGNWSEPLKKKTLNEILSRSSDMTETVYAEVTSALDTNIQGWFKISPVPTQTITDGLRVYFHAAVTLTDDSSVPPFPVNAHKAVVLAAAKFLMPETGEPSEEVAKELAEALDELRLFVKPETSGPIKLRPSVDKGY